MSIGSFVSASLDSLNTGRYDVALALVSSAVDASAAKESNKKEANNRRYKKFLKQNMRIITTFGFPGIQAGGIRIKCVNIKDLKVDKDSRVDIENIIYHIIRCGLIHQCELDSRIEFTEETYIGDFVDRFKIPSKIVLGLIMAVVLSQCNKNEATDKEFNLVLGEKEYKLNSLWGKGIEFIQNGI